MIFEIFPVFINLRGAFFYAPCHSLYAYTICDSLGNTF